MRYALFARLLMIFALLFTQAGSLMHGISHIVAKQTSNHSHIVAKQTSDHSYILAKQSSDHSLPHNEHCNLCAAYAQMGAALGSYAIGLPLVEQHIVLAETAFYIVESNATFHAFAARAPPYSS
ncbi:MAG: hypothetical protein Q9M15_08650 [Mariprofundaceae bacterium]|nr:hypothetical protein [Mariprofundaceae bacterium]